MNESDPSQGKDRRIQLKIKGFDFFGKKFLVYLHAPALANFFIRATIPAFGCSLRPPSFASARFP